MDISVLKTANITNAFVGDHVVYTVRITNSPANNADALVISDVLPSGITYLGHQVSLGTYTVTNGAWSVGTLNKNLAATLVITGLVSGATSPFITNKAVFLSSSDTDINGINNTGTAVIVLGTTDFAVSKTASTNILDVGSNVVFTIGITNIGTNAASSVVVQDLLPATLTFVSSSVGSAYNPTSGLWSVGTMAVGASSNMTVTAMLNSATPAVSVNVASYYSSSLADPNTANNAATAIVAVVNTDFSLSKTSDVSTADAGDEVSFFITISNRGPNAATGVLVSEVLPAKMSFVNSSVGTNYNATNGVWNVGSLSVGQRKVMELIATVDQFGAMKTMTNTAYLLSGGSMGDTNPANDSASVVIQGGRGEDPDLAIPPANFQSVDVGSLIIPMDTNYQALVTPFNMKAYGLVNSLLVSNIPVQWAISAGKTNNITDPDFTASTTRVYPTAQPNPSNRTFYSGPFIIPAGYAALAGPVISNFANSVTVYRLQTSIVADIRYTLTTKPQVIILDDGGTEAIHINNLIEAGIPTNQYIVRSGAEIRGLAATSCYTIVTAPHYAPSTSSTAQTAAVRLFVESGGNFFAQCHALLTYEVDRTNGAYHTQGGVGILDVDDATSFVYPNADASLAQFQGTLIDQGGSVQDWDPIAPTTYREGMYPIIRNAIGGTTTGSLRSAGIKILPNQLGGNVWYLGGHQYNAATLDSMNGRRVYMNAVLMPSGRPEECGFSFGTDLTIDKNDFRTLLLQGQITTYTITVSNRGPLAVSGALVSDIFPPEITNAVWTNIVFGGAAVPASQGTGNISQLVDMPVGSKIVYLVDAAIGQALSGIVSNAASVTAPLGIVETNPNNNYDDDVDVVIVPALSLSKTVSDVGASPGVEVVTGTNGQAVLYSFVVRNVGNTTLTNVVVTDSLLSYSNFVGTLLAGQAVTVTAASAISGDLTNTAFATGYDLLGDALSDDDPAEVIAINPDISIEKTVDDDTSYAGSGELVVGTNGQQVTYFFVVSNVGDVALTNVVVSDALIPFTTNIGTLAAGQVVTVQVNDVLGGSLTNTATATGQDQLGHGHSDSDTAQVAVINPAIAMTKTVGSNTTYAGSGYLVHGTNGQQVTYFFVVSNIGDVALTNVVVNDPLIPFTTNVGTLAVGQSVTVSVNDAISANLTNTATATGYDTVGNPHTDDGVAEVHQLMSISGSVFLDIDSDGTFDPEDTNGISNVIIVLLDGASNAVNVATTDVNGAYAFLNLDAGNYTVREQDPPGYFSTADVVGPNDNLIQVTLLSGVNAVDRDFLDAQEPKPTMTKVFVSASEPDVNGNFSATYNIVLINTAHSAGFYELTDTPAPDGNVTVNGAVVSGYTNLVFAGPGPYQIETNATIGASSTNTYTITLDLTLSTQVLNGYTNVSVCGGDNGIFEAGEGLFNEVTASGYSGTNFISITTNACGNVPPVLIPYKTFISASAPDTNGNFTATYTLTVANFGGVLGTYNLSDTPSPDTNVTVNGVSVTGQITTNYSGAGPYTLATARTIPAGTSHVYSLTLNLTLQSQVLQGLVPVSQCPSEGANVAGSGLFNAVTLTYGTNNTLITTNDCGDVPPVIVPFKTFVSASAPDTNGNFIVTYTLTVKNMGATSGPYNLVDTPSFDTNITVSGGTVSGATNLALTGSGPFVLASNRTLAAAGQDVYTLTLNAQLNLKVLTGQTNLTDCLSVGGKLVSGHGLFNAATVTYGTNSIVITTNDCGSVPPVIVPFKTFVSASAPDTNGNFIVTYTLTVKNTGSSSGPYDLIDTPSFDTNVTVNGGTVSGATNLSLSGSGPFLLASNRTLAAGAQDIYTVTLNAQLSLKVLTGQTNLTDCLSVGGKLVAGRGLFNAATVIYGTNSIVVTTNDCGNVPPVVVPFKTFVSASAPDTNGSFIVTYTLTVKNVGASPGPYNLVDTPTFDTNITVSGGTVSGATNLVLAGPGPYLLASNRTIAAGGQDIYTVTLNAQLTLKVLTGQTNLTDCLSVGGKLVAGKGLFNAATVTYGTNNINITTNTCGTPPPYVVLNKSFVSASDINGVGQFQVTYVLTAHNVGGSIGSYTLTDTPQPDPNVTINGGNVTGHTNLTLVGSGPYTLATASLIAASVTDTYTVRLDAVLSPAAMFGLTNVLACGEISGNFQAGEGLFNKATVIFGTNNITFTTNDCGNIPPIPRYSIAKTLVSPSGRPAVLGETVVFKIVITNNGEVGLGVVPVVDTYNTSLLSYVGAVPTNDMFAPGTITWTNVGPLAVGQSAQITVSFTATALGAGTNAAVASPLTTNGIPLIPQTSTAPHAASSGSISGHVYDDADADGSFLDPDPGIPGVTITLLYSNVVAGVTTTDVNGAYAFTNLVAGPYTIIETDLAGYFSTADTDGTNDNTIAVALATGQNSTGNDYLDAVYASVGDFVWLDLFGGTAGIQDTTPFEGGLPSIPLSLYASNGTFVASTTSGVNGVYAFTNLVPGAYYIRVNIAIGLGISPQFVGTNISIDNNVSPINAHTPVFTLVSGQHETNVDVGVYGIDILAQIESVSGSLVGGAAVLSWTTRSEYGTSGWYIQRENANGEWENVSDYLLAMGGPASGGVYTWADESAEPGQTYRYRIAEVEARGTLRLSDVYVVDYPESTVKTGAAAPESFSFVEKPIPAAKASAASANAVESAGIGSPVAVKVAVGASGLYRVSNADVAAVLGVAESAVAGSEIRVENLGRIVPASKDANGTVFYGESFENMYTDKNVYRLSLNKGRSVASGTVAPSGGSGASSFTSEAIIEQQIVLKPDVFVDTSADVWLWSRLFSGSISVFSNFVTTFNLPYLAPGTGGTLDLKLKGASAGSGVDQHGVKVLLNGTLLGQASFSGLEHKTVSFSIPAGLWLASGNQLKVTTTPQPGTIRDTIYVDGFKATYQRQFTAANDSLSFSGVAGGVVVTGFTTPNVEVWDVTDPWQPVKLAGFGVATAGGVSSVDFVAAPGTKYLVSATKLAAASLSAWNANTLKNTDHEIDYLVVYGPGLEAGAQALADDRTAKGLASMIVSIDDVFNAFNHGIRDGRALKAFLGYAYRQWQRSPRYILLAGDGSLDFRNYLGYADCLIPTEPESGGDGIYLSDHALGDVDSDGNLDLAVGRLPILTAAQFSDYLTKLLSYEQGGAWRDSVIVSTDNRDAGGVYIEEGDLLASKVAGRTVERADIEVLGVSGAENALQQGIENGAELSIYVGHGSIYAFAAEEIINVASAAAFSNVNKPSIVGSLGCFMGTFGYPGVKSVGESLITSPGGAAAVFASASLVTKIESSPLFELTVANVYQDGDDRMGDAWIRSKNAAWSANGSAVRSYQFLGDPSIAIGDSNAARGGPVVLPHRASYSEWLTWAFAPVWHDKGLSTDPNMNPDGDNLTNWEEYLAGTDPLDGTSELVVVTVHPLSAGRVELTWPSIAGRTYRIERASAVSGGYVTIADDVGATSPTNKWIDEGATTSTAVYRVYVK